MTTSSETLGRRIARLRLVVSVDELLSGASASTQETAAVQKSAAEKSTAEVVSVAADEPAEIVEEPIEQDRQDIATQSSGFSFGKLFGKSMIKVEKNDETDGGKKKGVRLGNGSAKHGLHLYVVSDDGDVVDMCVPLGLAKFVLNSGIQVSGSYLNQETQEQLSNINLDALMDAAKTGESGTLVDITSSDGDVVKIWFD